MCHSAMKCLEIAGCISLSIYFRVVFERFFTFHHDASVFFSALVGTIGMLSRGVIKILLREVSRVTIPRVGLIMCQQRW